jgi:hypothetical protein
MTSESNEIVAATQQTRVLRFDNLRDFQRQRLGSIQNTSHQPFAKITMSMRDVAFAKIDAAPSGQYLNLKIDV